MVKSADSDQIAKAREQLKERLEAFAGQWIASRTVYDDFEMTVAFAASERQAVIEDCCRAVCYFCVGEPWKPAKLVNGAWIHECDIGPDPIAQCNAAAIRSME